MQQETWLILRSRPVPSSQIEVLILEDMTF